MRKQGELTKLLGPNNFVNTRINENIPEEGVQGIGVNQYGVTENSYTSPTLSQVGIDKNDSPKFRILVEARLGELIQVEQKAGRLAKPLNSLKQYRNDNEVTTVMNLKDYGISPKESSRAQQIANHQDLNCVSPRGNEPPFISSPPVNLPAGSTIRGN